MFIRSLTVENLRAFKTGTLEFVYPGRASEDGFSDYANWPPRLPNVNLILGINGSGKSTLLDAIALAVLSPLIASSGYRPYSLIRRKAGTPINKASIQVEAALHKQDGIHENDSAEVRDRFHAVIERQGDIQFVRDAEPNKSQLEQLYHENSAAFFLVGYGATRRVEAVSASDLATRRKARLQRYERVASLFEEHFALTPLNAWLPEWQERNPGRHKQVITLLNRLLPDSVKFTGKIEDGDYLFKHGGITIPFGALSDGYRAYIGWIGDLLYHLCMGAPSGAKLDQSFGVVLVDEIDLHIHPEWQQTMIATLAKTLKNIQFIFTSHSALVVGSLERSNLVNVVRSRSGLPMIERPEMESYGLSADQILRSEMFGLATTRNPTFRKELDNDLSAAQKGEAGASIRFMRKAALGGAADEADMAEAAPPPDWLKKLAAKA
jgi:energy-coupling factor transporter ATP-binding protein EcfA2